MKARSRKRTGADERVAAARRQPPLRAGEGGGQRQRRGEAEPRPQRPAVLAPEHQRQHDRDQRAGRQQGAGQVEPAGALGARLADRVRRQRERGEPDRHVDEVAGAPAEAEQVDVDQQAADQLPAGSGEAEHEAVDGERSRARLALVLEADDRQRLRRHQRGGGALHDAAGDQDRRVGREAADGGGGGEQREADAEDAAAAGEVAEPPAEDQPGGERDPVGGDHELHRAGACLQVGLGRGDRDVDDEEVERDDEGAGQHDGHRQPRRRHAAGGGGERWGEAGGGHGRHGRADAAAGRLPAG